MIVDQQELGDQLRVIRIDDGLVGLVVLVRSTGDDDIDVWVLAILILLLDEQRVAGRNQTIRHGVSAIDGGRREITQRRRQRVRCDRSHLDIVEVLGDVLDFRRVARRRINLDETRAFQQLDAAGEIRAVIRHADLKGIRQRGGRGKGQRGSRGKGDDLLSNAIHKW